MNIWLLLLCYGRQDRERVIDRENEEILWNFVITANVNIQMKLPLLK